MQVKKFTALMALLLCAVMLFASCSPVAGPGAGGGAGKKPSTSFSTTTGNLYFGGATSNNPLTVQKPAFAEGAVFWEASSFNGMLEIDPSFQIVVENGNSGASSLATALSFQFRNILGVGLSQGTDNNAAVAEREILIGNVDNRNEYNEATLAFSRYMQYGSPSIGCFYIGVEDGKLILCGYDDTDYTALSTFLVNNYITGKSSIKFEGDLSSMYIYDKAQFSSNKTFAYVSVDSLEGDASLANLSLNGVKLDAFKADVFNYASTIYLSDKYPTISAAAVNGNAKIEITQPSAANGGLGSVKVTAANGKTNKTYTLAVQRLDYNLANATLYGYKNGAKGAVSLIQDDGFMSATDIMIETCVPLNLPFSVAIIANKVGTIAKADGKYVVDADGNFSFTVNGENAGMSGGGSLSYYRNLLSTYPTLMNVISHSYTHGSWGTTDANNVAAEIIGSKQLLQAAFPGQDVDSFVYPGFTSGTRPAEYEYARDAFMPGVYVAARNLSMAKRNYHSTNPLDLAACSMYGSTNPDLWGDDTRADAHGWLVRETRAAAKSGGWVVTMNHDIQDKDPASVGTGMTVSKGQFQFYIQNVLAPLRDSGAIWVDFVGTVGKYVTEYSNATLESRSFADGHIEVVLTDTLDNTLYNEALTVDVDIPADWSSVTVSYIDAQGNVTSTETMSANADGCIRLQIVPDSGKISIAKK